VSDLPIVCTLNAEALAARRTGLLADLLRAAENREAIPNGLRLRFPPAAETLAALTKVVDAERQCCRFLRFQITIEPDGGPMFLDLTGPTGTREFLDAVLQP